MTVLSIALELAAAGLPVFPCASNKKPAISKRDGGKGYLDATTDAARIKRLFKRSNAVLVGVPTGEESDFDVLDSDPRHGGHIWEHANQYRLPETRMHETQSGGRHYLFRHASGVRNQAGTASRKNKIADGIDVRGTGGYVIYPPSQGYRIISDAPLSPWPKWLLQPGMVLPIEKTAPPTPSSKIAPVSDKLLQAIIDTAVGRVRDASDGSKHDALRNQSRLLGGIAERAYLSDNDIVERMTKALEGRKIDDWENVRATALWGAQEGRKCPLTLKEQEAHAAPDPRRKETAKFAFRLLRSGVPGADILAALDEQNAGREQPLAPDVIRETVVWAARKLAEDANAR